MRWVWVKETEHTHRWHAHNNPAVLTITRVCPRSWEWKVCINDAWTKVGVARSKTAAKAHAEMHGAELISLYK